MKVKVLNFISVLIVIFAVVPVFCYAVDDQDRARRAEFYLMGQYAGGDTVSGLGLEAKLDSTSSAGLGLGYNLSSYLNFNWSMYYGQTKMKAQSYYGIPAYRRVSADTDVFAMDFNLDYNILKYPLTPVISGGIGFINYSGSVGIFDFNETDFSYNLGAGLRWDISRNFFIKAVYKATWTKLKDTDGTVCLDGPALFVGFVF